MKIPLSLRVNGELHEIVAPVHKTLLEVLREELDLTGTKHGCELGECGACTVLVDGIPVLACLTLPALVGDAEVTTVEGLATGEALHPLQIAFAEEGAAQCGYCTPGMLMTAKAPLDANTRPTRGEIAHAISGNLCRCTGYTAIYEAIEKASARSSRAQTCPKRWESCRRRKTRPRSRWIGSATSASPSPRSPLSTKTRP